MYFFMYSAGNFAIYNGTKSNFHRHRIDANYSFVFNDGFRRQSYESFIINLTIYRKSGSH